MNIYAVSENGRRFVPKNKRRGAWLVVAALFLSFLGMAAVTQIDLTTQVKNILPVANGGTGVAAPTLHGVMIGEASSATSATSAGALDNVLMGGGASADPSFVALTSCSAAGDAVTYNISTHAWGCATGYGAIPTFVNNETPSGSLPGTTLTLAHTPNPAASLELFYNGQLLTAGGADFTLATATITLTNSAPAGTVFLASYRY